jgi:hypothetical protein
MMMTVVKSILSLCAFGRTQHWLSKRVHSLILKETRMLLSQERRGESTEKQVKKREIVTIDNQDRQ